MYSKEIQKMISKINAKIGEEVIVWTKGKGYEGVLMPSIELGDPDCITIKLNNGYNVGLRFDKTMKIQKSKIKEPEEIKKEVEIEIGGKRKHLEKLKFDSKKPAISLITTGGTITSRVSYKTGGVTSLMSPIELLNVAPELADIVNLKDVINPFTRMSESIGVEDYQELAKTVAKELNKTEGVILTHGTDTLHYTAAALSFMLPDLSKPVVLTGAQRSSDRGSSDAAMNLICSSNVAANSDFAEVGICMHGSIDDKYCLFNRGTKVRKFHTSRRDTFRPINDLPLAKIWYDGKIEIINKRHRKRSDRKVKADAKFEPKVALLKSYPNADPEIIDFFVDKKYKGLVIEATGLGQVPTDPRNRKMSWLPKIKKAIDSGVIVAFATQTIYGRLDPFVYSEARRAHELGVIYCEDILPETAYIKLGWVLGHTKKPTEVKKMMLTNYAGEISTRTLPETFLY